MKINNAILSNAFVQVLSRLASFVLSAVLARVLGPEGFGFFSLNLTLVNVVVVFACIGVPAFLTREIATLSRNNDCGSGWTIFSAAFGLITLLASVACMLLVSFYSVSEAFRNVTGGEVFYVSLFLVLCTCLLRITAGALRGVDLVAKSQFFETALVPMSTIILVVALDFFDIRDLDALLVMTIFCLVTFVTLMVARRDLKRRLSQRNLASNRRVEKLDILRSSLPFSLIGVAAVFNSYADIFMLAWFVPAAEVGLYRIAAQGALLVAFGLQIVQMVGAPKFARLNTSARKEDLKSEFQKLRILSGTFGAVVFALLAIAGYDILGIVFGLAYQNAYLPLIVLCFGYFCNAAFGPVGVLLSMCGEESLVSRVLWLSVVVNLVLNLVLINAYGAVGAAVATSITMAAVHPVLWFAVRKKEVLGHVL